MKKNLYIGVITLMLMVVGSNLSAQKIGGSANVTKINPCQVYVPNAFTPNGDNINELFTIKYNGECSIQEFKMHVFDRWGRLVFEITDPDPSLAWDGTHEGMELKEGVYMWKVSCRLVDPSQPGESQLLSEQGSVVLIR